MRAIWKVCLCNEEVLFHIFLDDQEPCLGPYRAALVRSQSPQGPFYRAGVALANRTLPKGIYCFEIGFLIVLQLASPLN